MTTVLFFSSLPKTMKHMKTQDVTSLRKKNTNIQTNHLAFPPLSIVRMTEYDRPFPLPLDGKHIPRVLGTPNTFPGTSVAGSGTLGGSRLRTGWSYMGRARRDCVKTRKTSVASDSLTWMGSSNRPVERERIGRPTRRAFTHSQLSQAVIEIPLPWTNF